VKVSQAVIENWWRQGMMGGAKVHDDGIRASRTAKLLKTGTLEVYDKLPQGLCTTHADVVNADLLTFIEG